MRGLRIALVSEHASPLAALGGVDAGGQNVHVAALARELARLGCDVVVHTRRDDPDVPDVVFTPDGYRVDHVPAGPSRVIAKDAIYNHVDELAHGLAARWRAEPPDLVHAHFWMSGCASSAPAQQLGLPLVQTFHALGVVKQRHQGAADTSPPARHGIECQLAKESDAIVATCRDEEAELVALGASEAAIWVVPSGIDTAVFTPCGPRALRRPNTPRLVSVGRLVRRKGVGDVIAALAGIPRAELLVVGGGSTPADMEADDEMRRLRALAADAGVAGRVRFTGGLSHQNVASVLRSADVTVCAPWYEPFGIVPIEAMACGSPVVGTAVGGLLDTVDHGVTGLLVPPRQPAAVADAIRHLLADGDRRAAMGRRAAERASRLYDWHRIGRATLDVYRSVVGDRTGRTRAVETA
jgi:glycosyltransferase involved in cell wall biosynthesis